MSELMVFLRSSLGETVALSLLHFIWQGAALALVAVAAWKGLEKSSAQSRYTTGCALLLCMLLAPIVTSVFLTWQVPAGSPAALEYIPPPRVSPGDISAQSSNAMWFPAVLALWFAGVTAFSIRAAGGWALAIYRLSISRKEPPPVVRASALDLASRLGIIRIVRIYESSVASVPAVFGWLRPVIILPASVVTGLPASHLNAILAHELAHIARHDFLVNCLQSVVEVLLFYHPAVWWLSRKVRQEREICCDATAAEMCGDRILYSRALLSLEEGRQEFALAATGGDLKSRIEHLLQQGARHNRVPELTSFVPALIVFATVLMCAASMIVRAQEKKIETPYEKWAKEDVLYIMQPKIGLHGSDCAPMRSASTSLLNFGSVAILLPKPARMSSRKSTTAVSPTRTHVSGTPGQAGRRHEVACTSGMDRPMRSSLTRVRIAKCGSIGTADSLNLAGKTTG